MSWVIYKHTLLIGPNKGKCYIGQTCKKPSYRWNSGKGYTCADTHFARAILLYGWNNFSHEIIETDIDNATLADEREIYWIKFYDSFHNGFNSTYGGNNHDHEGKTVFKLDPSDLKILGSYKSISLAAQENHFNATNIARCCRKEGVKAYGFYWCFKDDYLNFEPKDYLEIGVPVLMLDKTNYHIIKRFKSLKDAASYVNTNHTNIMQVCQRRNSFSNGYAWCYEKDYFIGWEPKPRLQGEHGHKKVICVETRITYKSENEAARQIGTSVGNIHQCLKYRQKTIKGFHFAFLDDFDESYIPPLKFNPKKEIYCFENDKIYESISMCSLELNVSASQIIGVCKGKQSTAKNMHFCYLDERDNFVLKTGKQRNILCVETGIVYRSHKEAFEKTGIKHIIECCRGNALTAGGYHWCYEDEKDTFTLTQEKTRKKVLCVEDNKIFNSMKEACDAYHIDPSCLSAACKGKQKTAGGYHWKYVDE
ncbi:MAG: hypothetical protein K6E11_04620 [Bacilli bacterium]|nr:hypothetical protein [Bacilli bacterium]